jgi:hypothetical protein
MAFMGFVCVYQYKTLVIQKENVVYLNKFIS